MNPRGRAFCVLTCLLLLLLAGAPLVAAPSLVVESTTVDLGQVVRGAAPEAEFLLHNRGDVEGRILKVKPG